MICPQLPHWKHFIGRLDWFTVLTIPFPLVQALPLVLRFWTRFRPSLVQGLLSLLLALSCSLLMLQLPVLETGVVLLANTLVDKCMGSVVVLLDTLEADKVVDIAVDTPTNLYRSLCQILRRSLCHILCPTLCRSLYHVLRHPFQSRILCHIQV